jgi:hypothetical protein
LEEERRFGPIERVVHRLGESLDREQRLEWLVTPNALLGGNRPLDALADGSEDDVMVALDQAALDDEGML